jgi:hypothetical protein
MIIIAAIAKILFAVLFSPSFVILFLSLNWD